MLNLANFYQKVTFKPSRFIALNNDLLKANSNLSITLEANKLLSTLANDKAEEKFNEAKLKYLTAEQQLNMAKQKPDEAAMKLRSAESSFTVSADNFNAQ